jgi:hypothetical protein
MTTAVAPNVDNTLTVPVRRLPLGVPIPTDAGPTRWKVWVPTALGGLLTISHSAATQIDIQQPLGTSLATGTTEATTVVAFGDCWVVIAGDSGALFATLVQKAWSRMADGDPTADPLLPWNFYYWPSNQSSPDAVKARAILKKYAFAVGNSGIQADDWEFANHQVPGAAGWAGHCHNAAPASALFEQPVAQTINGTDFDEEEMELLATEWFGNFGVVQQDWWLQNGTIPTPYNPAQFDGLAYLKPGDPKDRGTLIQGLGHVYDSPAMAVQRADQWVALAGGEAGFPDWAKTQFGQLAASFFIQIQTSLGQLQTSRGVGGGPLTSNMRSYVGADGPDQVWNQIFFYYEATFAETWPSDPQDDHDIKIACDLYSNIDQFPSPGLPGAVVATEVSPGTSSTDCQLYKNVWRIVFDDSGQINPSDDRNEWVSLQNDSGEELYAPTNLGRMLPPLAAPRQGGDPFMAGNPAVGVELLSYVKLNARYK